MGDRIDELRKRVAQLHENSRRSGKEGKGTHRNAGDAGRVADLWMEAKAELSRAEALGDA